MPNLKIEYQGEPLECGITKVDRAKLYGFAKTEILDGEGRPCQTATLASDGKTLIPSGGVALAYVAPDGQWRDKSDLRAVDLNGDPIEGVDSTFKTAVDLKEKSSLEQLLNHNIRMVYELTPGEEFTFPESLIEELAAGIIYTFPFSYRGGLTADTAFVVQGDDEVIWMLIGKPTEIEMLSCEQTKGMVPTEDSDEEEEDLDFNMF